MNDLPVRPCPDEVLGPIHRRGDRVMATMLLAHALAALAFATFYDTWLVTLVVTGLALAMFGLA